MSFAVSAAVAAISALKRAIAAGSLLATIFRSSSILWYRFTWMRYMETTDGR